ncbi:hypothetical protein APS67_003155 [Streptomyces sp. AVP053U2]|nr:hypothetical protein APS67_003155 [Streptomyces sp. AVP053U2]
MPVGAGRLVGLFELTVGERRQDKLPFPDPEGITGRSPVWRWGDVNAWLAQFGEGDDVHPPTREEALTIDFLLPE